jgi:hypothetical protein
MVPPILVRRRSTLPCDGHVIGELKRECGHRRPAPRSQRAVRRRHFLQGDARRPAVPDGVAHGEQDDALSLCDPHHARPEQRRDRELEWTLDLVAGDASPLLSPARNDQTDPDPDARRDHLNGASARRLQ